MDAIGIASAKKPKTEPPVKRKKSPTPEHEVELGDEATDDDEGEPRSAKKQKTAASAKKAAKKPVKKVAPKKKLVQRKKKQATPSDDEDEQSSDAVSDEESEASFHDSESDAPKKKVAARKGGKRVVESEDEESELSDVDREVEAPKKVKTVAKKASPKKAAPKKRLVQKKKIVEDDEDEDALSSPLSDEEEEDDSEPEVSAPKRQRAGAKEKSVKVAKGKVTAKDAKKLSSTQVIDSADEDVGENVKFRSSGMSKKNIVSDDEDGDKDVKSISPSKTKPPSKRQKKTQDDDEESEMSDVLDPEPVKKVRESAATSKSIKSTTKSASKSKAAPKASDPKAEEIKTLTQQLGKCGVRKVWGAYLNKQFGDDHKAKVRHLKEQLREIGMEGRFSEQRAKEIKERRELEGDLEILKETASKWGADPFGTSGRPSRRTAASRRSLKEPELSEEEGVEKVDEEDSDDSDAESGSDGGSGEDGEGSGDDEECSDGDVKPKSVKRARKGGQDAGLAFLGSESESD